MTTLDYALVYYWSMIFTGSLVGTLWIIVFRIKS